MRLSGNKFFNNPNPNRQNSEYTQTQKGNTTYYSCEASQAVGEVTLTVSDWLRYFGILADKLIKGILKAVNYVKTEYLRR
jgi:hypothetical protein